MVIRSRTIDIITRHTSHRARPRRGPAGVPDPSSMHGRGRDGAVPPLACAPLQQDRAAGPV